MFIRDGDDRVQRRRFSRRAIILGLGQVGAAGVLAGRLYQLQVMDQARYALLADDNRISYRTTAPERGRILDAHGRVLADNEEHYRLTVTPAFAGDLDHTLLRLQGLVAIADEDVERIRVRARRQPSGTPVIVANDLTFEQLAAIGLELPGLPGVDTEIAWRRRTHHGDATAFIVGMVGAVERLALDDDPAVRLPGMRIGKSGVELSMEGRLRGVGGTLKQEVDARGRIVRTLERSAPQRGEDVTITIDAQVQAQVLARLRQERRAAVVALEVETGAIRAMASVPSRDPRALQAHEWERIEEAADDPLFNRALLGLYPPGSTFKMVTALAALEAGVVTPRSRITCEGSYHYADQVYRCWNRSGHGDCNLHRALRESCDVYFYEVARRLGIVALANMAERLGFGQTYADGISRQRAGVVPTPDWKRARFGRPWHGGETLHAAIGQGYVSATPLQMAVMSARLATGRAIVPHLVAPEGRGVSALEVAPAHLEAVRRGLDAVVNEAGGTGHNAQLEDEDGRFGDVDMAGKTGTSQVHRKSSFVRAEDLSWEHRDHALFVGYAPARRPRYAVAAVVEHGASGGKVAAPLVRDVMRMLLSSQAERAEGARERDGGSMAPGRRAG